ncbi:MAG: flagellar hook-associated protein FlgL [Legionellales bacterium]
MTMRLPTISQFKTQLTQMSQQYNQVSTLQIQVATGKKLQQASDDPMLASQITSVEDYIARLDSYTTNTTLAQNRLSLLHTTLQEQVDLTIKAQELLLRSQNGTLNDKDRAGIAIELSGVLDQMLRLANTQDGNSDYLFSGSASTQPYVQNGNCFQYQGSYDGNSILISDQNQVQYSDSGYAVFGNIKSGNGTFSVAADASMNTGTGILQPITLLDAGSIINDDYILTMVTNSAGQLAYEIVGSSSGQVIPVPPLAAPTDAPAYTAGSSITFNGISTQLDGAPAVGDTFAIRQSRPQNVFQTLQQVIDALNTPIASSAKNQADVSQILLEKSSTLSGSLNHLVDQLAGVGTRAKAVENQIKLNKDMSLNQQVILGSLADVDMAQSISDLTQQLTALSMSQQSYTKIQEIFSQLMRDQFR